MYPLDLGFCSLLGLAFSPNSLSAAILSSSLAAFDLRPGKRRLSGFFDRPKKGKFSWVLFLGLQGFGGFRFLDWVRKFIVVRVVEFVICHILPVGGLIVLLYFSS